MAKVFYYLVIDKWLHPCKSLFFFFKTTLYLCQKMATILFKGRLIVTSTAIRFHFPFPLLLFQLLVLHLIWILKMIYNSYSTIKTMVPNNEWPAASDHLETSYQAYFTTCFFSTFVLLLFQLLFHLVLLLIMMLTYQCLTKVGLLP